MWVWLPPLKLSSAALFCQDVGGMCLSSSFLCLIVVVGSAWQIRASGWVTSLSSGKATIWSSSAADGPLLSLILSQQGDLGFFHSLFIMKSILLLVCIVLVLMLLMFVFPSYFLYWLLLYHLIWCNSQFIFLDFTCQYTIRVRKSTLAALCCESVTFFF